MTNEELTAIGMKPSRLYEVEMRYQAGNHQWVTRVMRARWVGCDQYDIPTFSLRPHGKLQSVPILWVKRVRPCDPGERVCLPYDPDGDLKFERKTCLCEGNGIGWNGEFCGPNCVRR